MPRILPVLILPAAALLSIVSPAFAGQNTPLVTDHDPAPMTRIIPTNPDYAPIELTNQPIAAVRTETPIKRVFSQFDGQDSFSAMDIEYINAEIEQRFGRRAAIQAPQTGLIFQPDPSMFLKPLKRDLNAPSASTLDGILNP